MKRVLLVMMALVFVAGGAWADDADKDKDKPKSVCPKTLMGKDCFTCHVIPTFRIKESAPDAWRNYPVTNMKIVDGKGHFYFTDIDPNGILDFFRYLDRHEIKHAIIEIYSPGGSLFGAWRIQGIMNEYKAKGITIETRCYGFAASAGFLVFCAGSQGHRLASPQAFFMWHELLSFEGFGFVFTTPADKEDGAKVLRQIQDSCNKWLQSVSKMKKEDIDQAIRKKELWLNGYQAVEKGFADGFVIK